MDIFICNISQPIFLFFIHLHRQQMRLPQRQGAAAFFDAVFFINQSDEDSVKYLKVFTFLPKEEINEIEKDETRVELFKDKTFFKERWIKENGLEQKLIVTYSLKYRNYQRQIRNSQIERAKIAISNKTFKLDKCNQNDFKRFIKKTNITQDGEIAEKKVLSLNTDTIEKEERFDGFYGVCTNLDDEPEEIIKVNQRRWEIEESFRIMKSEFKARPVYLSRDDRITAHFTTCFLSLVILRFLEKMLDEKPAIEVEDFYRDMLRKQRKNILYNDTVDGVNRTDFKVFYRKKRMPAELCSTGEQKSLLISIILAQTKCQTLDKGFAPVLLLDEVVAHLDEFKREALLSKIKELELQAWITSTDPYLFTSLQNEAQFFEVKNNQLIEKPL